MKTDDLDVHWMRCAYEQACIAEQMGEVPVGAVIIQDGQLIAAGHNRPITNLDPSAHAEMETLRAAARILKNYRLPQCTIYTTLEPCLMCVGAIFHARLARIVYAAASQKTGAIHSNFQVFTDPGVNHHTVITSGIIKDECGALLTNFFQKKRKPG